MATFQSTGGIWRRPPKKGEDAYWRLVITIDKRYQRYFGLDSWSQSDSDGVECDYVSEIVATNRHAPPSFRESL